MAETRRSVCLHDRPSQCALARRFPPQCIVPLNRFFLNSSFSQSARLRRRQREPALLLHPEDAAFRGIADGARVLARSARGSAVFRAVVSADTRPGVAVIERIGWATHQAGGRSVNALTDDREADMGGGAVFHCNLIEVAPDSPGRGDAGEA
jgi:anaerobic selenocysteine-containing dehydrogenase